MSRAEGTKLYSNFSRGLITEATEIAFPENASIDELNCDIQENGKRIRRRGFERNGVWEATNIGESLGDDRTESFLWRAVGKEASVDFLCVQLNNRIEFHLNTGQSTFTKKTFSIDLTSYLLSGSSSSDLRSFYVQMASGRGELFIAHPHIEPLRVVYDPDGDSITVSTVKILMRDFVGLDDQLAIDEEPTTLSSEHNYNLRNQGWVSPEQTGSGTSITSFGLWNEPRTFSTPTTTGPIAEYFAAEARYPSNAQIWWASKDDQGDFDPAGLTKIFFGNTRAGRGHFILDAFNKDRSAVSGVSGITAEVEVRRPRTVEFYEGRIFWGYKSQIFFSPILEDGSRAGQAYQEADPTSEDISDLLPTDGGVIDIPHAEEIVRIVEMGNGVVVFAKNGIWFIAASAQGFSASDYSIYKVSEIGTTYARSVIKAETSVYWWSDTGIHGMTQSVGQFGPIAGQFDQNNLSEQTIDRFYNAIARIDRESAKGVYDPAQQKVLWIYTQPVKLSDENLYTRLLWFDTRLQAFVPWEVNPSSVLIDTGIGFRTEYSRMVDVYVSPEFALGTEEETFLEFLAVEVNGFGQYTFRNYNFNRRSRQDWLSHEESPTLTYESYLETGYELLGDGMRTKQAPHVEVYFKRTEEGLTETGDGEWAVVNPSSCFFQARWDWGIRADGRWSREVQVYRPKATVFADNSDGATAIGADVVTTKTKVRGSGRAVQFRFSESRADYGFELLGWQVFYQAKTRP
jgi:hypothetical protein